MKDISKARLWRSGQIILHILAAYLFLGPVLFMGDFLRPGSGVIDVLKLLLGFSLIPLILFSVGMICRGNAIEFKKANKVTQGIREELAKPK